MVDVYDITPEYEVVDHLKSVRGRVTYAWEDRVVYDSLLQIALGEVDTLEEVFRSLKQDRTIDRARGRQLDLIGELVEQPREIVDADMLEYFSYHGVELGQPFGDLQDSGVGGIYWDMNNPLYGDVVLTDEEYRLFIKAKIFKDNSRATPEDIVAFMKFVFDADYTFIYENSYAHFDLMVFGQLTSFQRTLLGYWSQRSKYESWFIPKPIGVDVTIGAAPSTDTPFAFRGFPASEGFSDLQCSGGVCVSIGGGVYSEIL